MKNNERVCTCEGSNSSVSSVYPRELFIRSKCYIFLECPLKEKKKKYIFYFNSNINIIMILMLIRTDVHFTQFNRTDPQNIKTLITQEQ